MSTFYDFTRVWWFDNKDGKSNTGTAPQFLRIHNDDICVCPQCREGFDKDDYKDDTCECWNIHNLIFKCSIGYEICTYDQFVEKLAQYREYILEYKLVDGAITTDDKGLNKQNCVFLQFQQQYKFKEMFICLYGDKAEDEIHKLKTVINSS